MSQHYYAPSATEGIKLPVAGYLLKQWLLHAKELPEAAWGRLQGHRGVHNVWYAGEGQV